MDDHREFLLGFFVITSLMLIIEIKLLLECSCDWGVSFYTKETESSSIFLLTVSRAFKNRRITVIAVARVGREIFRPTKESLDFICLHVSGDGRISGVKSADNDSKLMASSMMTSPSIPLVIDSSDLSVVVGQRLSDVWDDAQRVAMSEDKASIEHPAIDYSSYGP